MSKTATKKTKKPDPKAAGERALNQRKIAMEEEALRIRRIVSKMLEPMQERLTALESRSAPAEEWVPLKVGDYVKKGPHFHHPCNNPGEGTPDDAVGVVMEVRGDDDPRFNLYGCDFPGAKGRVFGFTRPGGANHFVPATEAEVSEHKAKEEQRAKEAEWAKYDVLQEGDAVRSSVSERIELAGLANEGGVPVCRFFPPGSEGMDFSRWDGSVIIRAYEDASSNNWLPFAEFKRRLQGTIAKRAEEERAKEMAKVPEFGNRVELKDGPPFGKFDVHEARYIGRCGSMFMFAYPHPNDPNTTCTIVAARHEFTVIEQ